MLDEGRKEEGEGREGEAGSICMCEGTQCALCTRREGVAAEGMAN